MSWKAENWLAENCDLAFGVPRALLFAMANQANDEGSLMAKNGTYMKRLNVTERSVQRATADLVKKGWIQKIPDYSEDGRQLCNVYRIVMPPNTGGGRVTPASPPQGDPHVTLRVTPSVTPGVTPAVTPIKNLTEKPTGEPTNTPPSPLTGGGAASSARVTQAERTATAGLQALKERLWAEQRRHVDRKIGRAIKSRLRAGESVESLWADYFALRPGVDWDPPQTDDPEALEILRRIAQGLVPYLSATSWSTWISPLRAVVLTPDPAANHRRLVVAFPSRDGQEWLSRNYGRSIQEMALAEGIGGVTFWSPESAA